MFSSIILEARAWSELLKQQWRLAVLCPDWILKVPSFFNVDDKIKPRSYEFVTGSICVAILFILYKVSTNGSE